jgi:signal transduction histidine kinase/predicted CoA-binding protein
MALIEDSPRGATVAARSPSNLIAIQQEQFNYLLDVSPSASRAMLHTVLGRWRMVEVALRQSEKMAQLGTLTAGIAHELNNPAAAVKRGAEQLAEALTDLGVAQAALARLDWSAQQQETINNLAGHVRSLAAKPAAYLDPLTRSDREYALEAWLEDHGTPDAWDLAPTLVNLGYDEAHLDEFAGQLPGQRIPVVVQWLGALYSTHNLLTELSQGAQRISDIVKALKSYSYLDQAPVQSVDIHEGLDNTLLILRNKLAAIKVQRDYAMDLPKIEAYGSELNQVWTNLIDNAADALTGTPNGEIVISTRREDDWVTVTVQDNGPGIPPENQNRIFDAFFTTKPPGKGTGLGLEITYNIVVNKHRGDIKVFSQPGRTCFFVTLPVNFNAVTGAIARPAVATLGNDDATMRRIIENARTIAVVGISARSERPGYTVPAYLQEQGYRIVPISPNQTEVLGERVFPTLSAVPEAVDAVLIFRPGKEVLPIVEEAIQIGAKAVWMQEGVVNEQAADAARRAGLDVVMDACMRVAHKRLMGSRR